MSIPCHERKWIDVDPGKFSQGCLEVSKIMVIFFGHDDTVHRRDDGAVRFDDLAENFKEKFDGTSQWSIEAWIAFLAKGGPKKRFQYCLNPKSSKHFLYFRAVLSLILHCIYHIGNAHDMHSIIQDGLIPGGKSQEGQAVSVFSKP